MQINDTIEILAVENGFIVRSTSSRERGMAMAIDDTMVFQSYKALILWIGEHFTHRNENVENDTSSI